MKYLSLVCVCFVTVKANAFVYSVEKIGQDEASEIIKNAQTNAEQDSQVVHEKIDDLKARDNLIGFMAQGKSRAKVLELCLNCAVEDLSVASIEILAKVAREEKQFSQAINYYSILQVRAPNNKNALLGLMLTNTEANLFKQADQASIIYENKFGVDAALLDARQYLSNKRVSDIEKLHQALTANISESDSSTQILNVYKAASSLTNKPIVAMSTLISLHPQLFKPIDKLWLKHDEATFLIRVGIKSDDKKAVLDAITLLKDVIAGVPVNHDLYRLANQDMIVGLVYLRDFKQAEKTIQDLLSKGFVLPTYVLETRADAFLGMGYSKKAIKIYESLYAQNPQNSVLQKLLMAYADAEEYKKAQTLLDGWVEEPTKGDFTFTQQTVNSGYEQWIYWRVKLKAWRGDLVGAEKLMKQWSDSAPANPWSWNLAGDLERWKGMPNHAELFYQNAAQWLPPNQRYQASVNIAQAKLDQGNIKSATEIVQGLPSIQDSVQSIRQRLVNEKKSELSVGYQHVRTNAAVVNTSQANQENNFELKWQSKANNSGHRFFTHYERQTSKQTVEKLQADYLGVGAVLNFYPINLSIEAGTGHGLNRRGYIWTKANYRLNDYWHFNVSADLNSGETPLKALSRGDYANQYGVGATYRPTQSFSTGIALSVMPFSDHNLRRSMTLWGRQALLQRDRWRVGISALVGISLNREVNVAYFNPTHDFSSEAGINLSYRLPIEGQRSLLQELNGSIGQYRQSGFQKEGTWSVAYRHQWTLSPTLKISYQLGRKRAIYDGQPEYKTFTNADIQWRF